MNQKTSKSTPDLIDISVVAIEKYIQSNFQEFGYPEPLSSKQKLELIVILTDFKKEIIKEYKKEVIDEIFNYFEEEKNERPD